ncbi:GntR family transcriptional regulator [Roseomonas sp. OT10]|uniref:GntR family transcriptional regulator n=1 Tax=Roseomonas cutis TaxID=2897332 RepID=UPI001E38009A|nr:GntR family transcriptional regulator [Roseomonas sp. OT10]UFN49961.1 GntR family transcriptional regulator [Roseomonas sp. OT10]
MQELAREDPGHDDDELRVAGRVATVRAVVEDRLRAAIMRGRFRPGQRLPERELCALTGVGRTSVREALRQLEAEGLVVVVPHRGPAVAAITPQEARDLYAVRSVLEGFAGRGCAERARPEHRAALSAAMAAIERAGATGDDLGVMRATAAFYAALLDGHGNEALRRSLGTLHNQLNLLRFGSVQWPGRLPRSIAELRAIHDAVLARDPDAAEAACLRHMREAAEAAQEMLAAPPPDVREAV